MHLHAMVEQDTAQQDAAQRNPHGARKACVLVVENDPAIRGMLRLMLDLEGYTVQAVAEGAEALRELRAVAEPRVVLVNQLLPDGDGREMLVAATAHPTLARHRYVLMSTCATCDNLPDLTRHAAFLPKPFSVEQLLDVVEAAARHLPMSRPSTRPVTRLLVPRTPTPALATSTRIATIAAMAATVLSAAAALVAAIEAIRSPRASDR